MKKLTISILISALVLSILPINFTAVSAKTTQEVENVRVMESSNYARISWETTVKTKSKMSYGTDSNHYSTLVTDDYYSYDHSITLKGLETGTTYYFFINSGSNSEAQYKGTFTTLGEKKNLTVYQPYFSLLFENGWENINGVQPTTINDPSGINMNVEGFNDNGLTINRSKSYLQYSCNDVFNSGYGTITAWVKFDTFKKDAVIFETDNHKYSLAYEVGRSYDDFDKRIVGKAGDGKEEVEFIIDPDGSALSKWNLNEWHFVALTWEGKLSGKINLYVDGRRADEANYDENKGCSNFRIANSYNTNDAFSIGTIDELKLHEWKMNSYFVNKNYQAYSYNPKFYQKGTPKGVVAGESVRYFKDGKIIKAPDNKVYLIANDRKSHVSDMDALRRLRPERLINATYDEVDQYSDNAKFYVWSKYLRGSLLKSNTSNTVYWYDGYELHAIPNESIFAKYGNEWQDVITISQTELNAYRIGPASK
jgi:hypothetical protein